MLFKGSCMQLLSWKGENCGLDSNSLLFWIPPGSLELESTLPSVAYQYSSHYFNILNVEHLYWTLHSPIPHPYTTTVVQKMKLLLQVRYINYVGLQGILKFTPLWDAFLYWLPIWIHHKEELLLPRQFKVTAQPNHLRWTFPTLQRSLRT